jgi:hypothetical protein
VALAVFFVLDKVIPSKQAETGTEAPPVPEPVA